MARQGKVWSGRAGLGMARQGKVWLGKARLGKARHGMARNKHKIKRGEEMSERRTALDKVSWRTKQNSKQNTIRIGDNESKEHAIRKCEVCHKLLELGKRFYTECVFKNGLRADIYVLDDDLAIEIQKSEPDESIEKKRRKYPCPIITIKTTGEFEKELWT
jgi:hypothetical protein